MRKIINDPVHGFITINDSLIYDLISHPYFQRLRRIKQMALAYLVYPGAVHTRLHHALGAYHLMHLAIVELKQKGVEISKEEEQAVKIAILLHDIGHGPFSHALEQSLVQIHHEEISWMVMHKLNATFEGKLSTAIEIFTNTYPKKFLHQLLSGQLDLDRLDYLARDSFFTGVSEGVVGYDRIIKMLAVHNDELVVEEKGIHSIEKFLISRRLMYWQVYLHKTVLCAELMMNSILQRVKDLFEIGIPINSLQSIQRFIENKYDKESFHQDATCLEDFLQLDDYDITMAIKIWSKHEDTILADLCERILNRKLFKLKYYNQENEPTLEELKIQIQQHIKPEHLKYYLIEGVTSNKTYSLGDENIKILFKNNEVKELSKVDNTLLHDGLLVPTKKHYICYLSI